MPSVELPETDHVLRYAQPRNLRVAIDENDNQVVIGLLPDAFRRKPEHKNLSVTWVECFPGLYAEQTERAIQAFRTTFKSSAKLPFKGAFGVGKVSEIKRAVEKHSRKVRILHHPELGNEGHSEIHRLPNDDDDLLETLAIEAFPTFIMNSKVPPFPSAEVA
jgi:hypothetical protein